MAANTQFECHNSGDACSELQEYRQAMDVLQSALLVGEGILVNGGESSEAERTAEKICMAYGAKSVSVWAITNLISASLTMPDGFEVSSGRRVSRNTIDLMKLQKFHELAHRFIADRPGPEERKRLYDEVAETKDSSGCMAWISGAICSAGWCLHFGGAIFDTCVAAVLGFVAVMCLRKVSKYFNNMATTIIIAALMGTLASVMLRMGLRFSYSMIAIAVIMIQLPTLQVVNGNRELFGGDIVCGTLKILQATLTTIAIAIGYAVVMVLFKNAASETAASAAPLNFVLGGCLGVLGSALMFKAPVRSFPFILGGALITAFLWMFFSGLQFSDFANTYVCAIFIMIYSLVFSCITKENSVNSLLLPIVTILLPGRYFYYSINYLVKMNDTKFWMNVEFMTEMVVGIVLGIVTVTLLVEFVLKLRANGKIRGK